MILGITYRDDSVKILTEKFSLSEDGLFLYAEITVDDPVYLTEPPFIIAGKKLQTEK